MDRVLGGIHIGSYSGLIACEENFLDQNHITHIVSVLKEDLPDEFTNKYNVLPIPINDDESTNIIQYFDPTNDYINKALFPDDEAFERGVKKAFKTCVLVVCQAGISRSSTILAAYLMKKYNLKPEEAIHAIRRKRPMVQPNDNFKEQLDLYYTLNCQVDKSSSVYRRWLFQHSLKIDPSGQEILSKDSTFVEEKEEVENGNDNIKDLTQLRCKRCRQRLALSTSFITHVPPPEDSRQSQFIKKAPNSRRIISAQAGSDVCSHYFVEPLNWMKAELRDKAVVEGKFQCPKCETKVGGYSWKGSRCSCGKWMVPAIHLQRAKVDEIKMK